MREGFALAVSPAIVLVRAVKCRKGFILSGQGEPKMGAEDVYVFGAGRLMSRGPNLLGHYC